MIASSLFRARLRVLALAAGPLVSSGVLAQDNPYRYVKMSLMVPWTLYFIFLACVLIPFVVMIVLAWRKQPNEPEGGARRG